MDVFMAGLLIPVAVATVTAESQEPTSALTGNPILDALLSFGAVGIVLLLAAVGYVWFKPGVDQLKADKALLQETNAKLVETYEEKVIPALVEAIRVMAASTKAADASIETQREVASKLSGLETAVSGLVNQSRGGG